MYVEKSINKEKILILAILFSRNDKYGNWKKQQGVMHNLFRFQMESTQGNTNDDYIKINFEELYVKHRNH